MQSFFAGALGGLMVVAASTFIYWWVGAKTFWEVWSANSGWAAAIAAVFVGFVSIRPVLHTILEKKKENSIAELKQANSLLKNFQDTVLEMFQPENNIIEQELRKFYIVDTPFDAKVNRKLNGEVIHFQTQFITILEIIEEYWVITQPLNAGLEVIQFETVYAETSKFLNMFCSFWGAFLSGGRELVTQSEGVPSSNQVLDQLYIVHANLMSTASPTMQQLTKNREHIRDIRRLRGMV